MIGEAVDTLITLGWVFLGWITVLSAGLTLVLLGTVAAVWRIARTAHLFLRARRASDGPVSHELPESVHRLPRPPDRRSAPAWAVPADETPDTQRPQKAA